MLRKLLLWRPIAELPVRVRSGVAQGAQWTFFPWTSYWRGTHEPELQQGLINLWSWPGKHVWDLGTHYGLYAIGLARRVGPTGTVAAFEPNPLSFRRLTLHVRRNKLSGLRAFNVAVSDENSEQKLFVYNGLESTTTHLAYDGEIWDPSIPTLDVPTRRLDDLVDSGEINLPDFIKVDVEGHGHRALRGASRALALKRPVILCSFHSSQELEGVRAMLDPLGYNYRRFGSEAISDPEVGHDYLARPA